MSESAEVVKDAMGLALGQAIDRIFVKADQTPFDQLVEAFKALEADFVSRYRLMGDEFLALDTKRVIAKRILITAIDKAIDEELPFEACRPFWNNVVELGFNDLESACTPSWYYAELGCLLHGQIEEGIRVVEPMLLELTRTLSDPALPETARSFYGKELQRFQGVLEKLRAQQRA